ncbi:hypothetical protein GCM10012287_56590 [Streptomyces daqingensis]|uniref:Uncharacterized protein n=1 Tax=Streptomyces daqingensis TaxID=1472640 RepID=A0ABQ2MTS7_9ACTN|nr:hypothetical protein GCM10012287_56590 [Streptomyces daqingensis]
MSVSAPLPADKSNSLQIPYTFHISQSHEDETRVRAGQAKGREVTEQASSMRVVGRGGFAESACKACACDQSGAANGPRWVHKVTNGFARQGNPDGSSGSSMRAATGLAAAAFL